jgi:hypothetical protein
MKENWVKIYSSTEFIQVKLAEDILKQHGIESHILTPPDSAFPGMSEIELYTLPEKAEEAVKVLQEHGIE